jgi:hypothetical protein
MLETRLRTANLNNELRMLDGGFLFTGVTPTSLRSPGECCQAVLPSPRHYSLLALSLFALLPFSRPRPPPREPHYQARRQPHPPEQSRTYRDPTGLGRGWGWWWWGSVEDEEEEVEEGLP